MPKTCGDCEHWRSGTSNGCCWREYQKLPELPFWAVDAIARSGGWYTDSDTDAARCGCFSSLAKKQVLEEAKQILDAEIDSRVNSFEEKLHEAMSALNIDPKKT